MLEIGYKAFPASFEVELPISKSILARQLVLDYVNHTPLSLRLKRLEGYFIPDDVQFISKALLNLERRRNENGTDSIEIEVGQSGTAYRFLVVLSLFEPAPVIIHHHSQLTKRITQSDFVPFEQIGANIVFRAEDNLTIVPKQGQLSGYIDASAWQTSQFSSALLLTQSLHNGRIIHHFSPIQSSFSYYKLTKQVIDTYTNDGEIEGDWSAAAFWYQLMVIHPEVKEIKLPNLHPLSAQPDRILGDLFTLFGVETQGNILYRIPHVSREININIAQSLDLFPSLLLSALWLSIPFRIRGTKHLRKKESDRIASVVSNLKSLGVVDLEVADDWIAWKGGEKVPRETISSKVQLNSFADHRIAMAFGVLATASREQRYLLEGEDCVSKSYPNFFDELLSK